jgi:hypothetical protein
VTGNRKSVIREQHNNMMMMMMMINQYNLHRFSDRERKAHAADHEIPSDLVTDI